MTAQQVERIVDDAMARWPLLGVRVIHRFGRLSPGERDWLKSEAPFWKKEHFAEGNATWVEAKAEDGAKARRWTD
jgi:molybdopterin synthase catalytic subunit